MTLVYTVELRYNTRLLMNESQPESLRLFIGPDLAGPVGDASEMERTFVPFPEDQLWNSIPPTANEDGSLN